MTDRTRAILGNDNVFADLGLPNPDEALLKADLAIALTDIIRARDWNQRQAADVLGIDQPKVSALMRGAINGFSVERLLRLLSSAGYDTTVSLVPVQSFGQMGRTRVIVPSPLDRPVTSPETERAAAPASAKR